MAVIDMTLQMDNSGNRQNLYSSTAASVYTRATLGNNTGFGVPVGANKLFLGVPVVTSCTLYVQQQLVDANSASASVVATWVHLTDIYGNTSPMTGYTGGKLSVWLTTFGAPVRVCASGQRAYVTVQAGV